MHYGLWQLHLLTAYMWIFIGAIHAVGPLYLVSLAHNRAITREQKLTVSWFSDLPLKYIDWI